MPDALESFDQFTAFVDSDGNPLSFGSIKFGTAGGDPEAAPQSPDADLNYTVPTYTSIPLNADGKMSTPAFFSGALSVSVYDTAGTEIYASENMEQAAPIVISSAQVWRDNATGLPLSGGKLYFGETHKDPLKSPKNVYSDSGFSTSIGSIVTLDSSGTTGSDVHLSGEYSLKVADSLGVQVGYEPKYIVITPASAGGCATANFDYLDGTLYEDNGDGTFVAASADLEYWSTRFQVKDGYGVGVRKQYLSITYEVTNFAEQQAAVLFDTYPDFDIGVRANSVDPDPSYSGRGDLIFGNSSAILNSNDTDGDSTEYSKVPVGKMRALIDINQDTDKDLDIVTLGALAGYSGGELAPNVIHCIELVDLDDITGTIDLLATGRVSETTVQGSITSLFSYNISTSRWEYTVPLATAGSNNVGIGVDLTGLSGGAVLVQFGIVAADSTTLFLVVTPFPVNASGVYIDNEFVYTYSPQRASATNIPVTLGQEQLTNFAMIPFDDGIATAEAFRCSSYLDSDEVETLFIESMYYVPAT